MTMTPNLRKFALATHVTSRGDRREDIYHDDDDRQTWLNVPSGGQVSGIVNCLLVADTQPKAAAARHGLRAGQRQR